MLRLIILCLVVMGFSFPFPAAADEDDPKIPTLSLDVAASRTVTQDTLRAMLTYNARSVTAKAAQEEVNQSMRQALAVAESVKDIRVVTGQYSTYEDPKQRTWNASQTLILEGAEREKLLEVAGKLQDLGFQMNQLSYFLSDAARQALTNALILEALKEAKERAALMSRETGYRNVRVWQVQHSDTGAPVPYARMAMDYAMAEAKSAPSARPDETDVSVNLHVVFQLVE